LKERIDGERWIGWAPVHRPDFGRLLVKRAGKRINRCHRSPTVGRRLEGAVMTIVAPRRDDAGNRVLRKIEKFPSDRVYRYDRIDPEGERDAIADPDCLSAGADGHIDRFEFEPMRTA
jgi:hypothetical protein